jgi:hypothetical protein
MYYCNIDGRDEPQANSNHFEVKTEISDIQLTSLALTTVGLFCCLQLLLLIAITFRRYRGLYFWSVLGATCCQFGGLLVDPTTLLDLGTVTKTSCLVNICNNWAFRLRLMRISCFILPTSPYSDQQTHTESSPYIKLPRNPVCRNPGRNTAYRNDLASGTLFDLVSYLVEDRVPDVHGC